MKKPALVPPALLVLAFAAISAMGWAPWTARHEVPEAKTGQTVYLAEFEKL